MKYFVIGIGGTGMRCIEAFTHLCAMGMCDNMEIDILSIDTDTNNGNKGRSEQLIERYRRIKGGDGGKPTANSFFTAKINLFKFAPEYSGNRLTFETISDLTSGAEDIKRSNKALADLFFDDDVQKFNLNHGYRAQTHMGSHLMYHAIVEAARLVREGKGRPEDRSLVEFINRIFQAGADARVFILGSIFGGTGASSIPILPRALTHALRVSDPNANIQQAQFGCSLLTEYFSFTVPDAVQTKAQKVIANSNNFSFNSQAALMFYEADETVKRTYQRMYHVGWPSSQRKDFSADGKDAKTITGGAEQRNPCHVTEFLCAAAALDFFTRRETADDKHEIVFRSANEQNGSFLFDFQDFIGTQRANDFMNRLGALYALGLIVINHEKGGAGQNGVLNLVKKFQEFGTPDYVNLPQDDARDIDDYLKAFAFTYEGGEIVPGWLLQVRETVRGSFLFSADAFSTNYKQLQGVHFGKLFDDESHQFAKKGKLGFGAGDPYNEFCNVILKDQTVKPSPEIQKVERLNEHFLAHTYRTLTKLYNLL